MKKVNYSPISSLSHLRKEMQRKVAEAGEMVLPGTTVAPPLEVSPRAKPVCVLLKTLLERGPVPDDMAGITSAAQLRDHVTSDGAVYRGAFETQGRPDSLVVVYADPTVPPEKVQRMAMLVWPDLERRYQQWKLGSFAAPAPTP